MNKWRMRLQSKFFVSMLLVSLIIVITFGGICLLVSKRKLNDNSRELVMELLEQLSVNMENNTETLLDDTFDFMNDHLLKNILSTSAEEIESLGIQKYRNQIRTIGSQYFSTSSPVYAVYLKNTDDITSWWVKYSKDFNYGNVSENYVENILQQVSEYMEKTERNTCWFNDENENKVYLARNIIRTGKGLGQTYATAVFAVDAEFFAPVEKNKVMISNQELFFQNRNSGMIYTENDNAEEAMQYIDTDYTAYGRSMSSIKMKDEEFLFIKYANRTSVWNLYCAVPKEKYLGEVYSLIYYMAGLAVSAVFLSLLISWLVSRSMTHNISDLEKTISKVEKGDFAVHIVPKSHDEIGDLCQHFNHMADKIEELIEQAYKEGKEKEKLKMTVLKAQINPHFLYNSLGSIKCMAKMEGKEDIAEMTTALIELLRASIGKTSEFQTVEQEIEYIRNYFVLQLYRYENAFRVEYDIAEETKNLWMINFVLQPLVENAVFHGIEISRKTGVIKIISCLKDGKLCMIVEDNGVGMSEEQVTALFQEKEQEYEGLNSIGVRNVYQRIQHYFGKEYGLHYESSPGNGCRVEVMLPVFTCREEVKANV